MVLSEGTRFQGCHVGPGTSHYSVPDPNLEIRRGGGRRCGHPDP